MLISKGSEKDIEKYHLKWIGQRKWDGVLAVAMCDDEVRLKGRNGTDLTKKFPEIVEELKKFKGIFIGELVCDKFKHIQSRVKTENKLKSKLLIKQYPAKFVIFDIVNNKNYLGRLQDLRDIFSCDLKNIELIKSDVDLVGLWEKAKKGNWEGIVIKNPHKKYENKRVKHQLKIKYVKSKDIVFNDYEVNPAGIKCLSQEGFKVQVSGSNAVDVKKQIDETGSCCIEVEYLNLETSGKLRHPVFKCKKD